MGTCDPSKVELRDHASSSAPFKIRKTTMENYLLNLSSTELRHLHNTGMMPALFTKDGRYDFDEMAKVKAKMILGYVPEDYKNFW